MAKGVATLADEILSTDVAQATDDNAGGDVEADGPTSHSEEEATRVTDTGEGISIATCGDSGSPDRGVL